MTIFTLVNWASKIVGPYPTTIRDFLTVEGLKGREVPKEATEALKAYRKLTSEARLRRITSLMRAMGILTIRPDEAPLKIKVKPSIEGIQGSVGVCSSRCKKPKFHAGDCEMVERAAARVLQAAQNYGDHVRVNDYSDDEQSELLGLACKYADLRRKNMR